MDNTQKHAMLRAFKEFIISNKLVENNDDIRHLMTVAQNVSPDTLLTTMTSLYTAKCQQKQPEDREININSLRVDTEDDTEDDDESSAYSGTDLVEELREEMENHRWP